jgi:hypothetical protein
MLFVTVLIINLKLNTLINLGSGYFFIIQSDMIKKCKWAAQKTLAGNLRHGLITTVVNISPYSYSTMYSIWEF